MRISNYQTRLTIAITCIVVSITIFIGVVIETEKKLSEPHIIEATNEEASFSFQIASQYMLYPGQEMSVNWNVNGIQDLYLNENGKIGTFEEIVQVDHCYSFKWTGETLAGTSYEFTFQPTYIFKETFFIAGIILSLSALLLAGLIYPIPFLRSITMETIALFNSSGKTYPGYYLPVMFTAVMAFLLSLSVSGSCVTVHDPIPSAQSSLLYEGLLLSSLFLLFIGLFGKRFRQMNVIIPVCLMGIMAYILTSSIQNWEPRTTVTTEWILISVISMMIIIARLLDKNAVSTELRILAVFILVALFINVNLALRPDEFKEPASNQLRDLSTDPETMDVYLTVRDYYYERQLIANVPDGFDLTPFRKYPFIYWSRVDLIIQDNPNAYLTEEEVSDILDSEPTMIQTSDFIVYLVQPTDEQEQFAMLTHISEDTLLIIPFEQLPQRIQNNWSVR